MRSTQHTPRTTRSANVSPPAPAIHADSILWRQGDVLAVNKPAHLAIIPGRGESTCLIFQLADVLGLPASGQADPRIRVAHRLDKDTTGVVLFVTNRAAQQHLSHQFQNNEVEKEYLALVAGRPETDAGEIDAPLGPHPTARGRMAIIKNGRRALTHWRVERRLGDWTLLRVFPKTGKTHQIRVHLKHIGLPLAVDELYNPPPNGAAPGLMLSKIKRDYRRASHPERPLIGRLTLHAHRVTFQTPQGERVTIEAPLPKDFRATINQLEKLARS